MPGVAAALVVAVLAILLACAVVDLRSRTIPNRLVVLVALLAAPYWLAAAPDLLGRVVGQAVVIAVALPILLLLFAIRAWGGGDVKLSAALLLWLPGKEALEAAAIMAVTGAVLALLILPFGRRATARGVPYGVGVAVAPAGPRGRRARGGGGRLGGATAPPAAVPLAGRLPFLV
jgi:prepilin peptidase CpaA